MNIIEPYVEIWPVDAKRIMRSVEKAGRVCYKSEGAITEDSYERFLEERIIKSGHHSVLEHEKVTCQFIVDRGVSHEIVRHRIAAYSQESTRYCNYTADKFGNEITLIQPFFFPEGSDEWLYWKRECRQIEETYFRLINDFKRSPQEARSILPNSLKTEIVVTYDLREWRHFFGLRAAAPAHPQMRQVAIPLLLKFKLLFGPVFADIPYDGSFPVENYARIVWGQA